MKLFVRCHIDSSFYKAPFGQLILIFLDFVVVVYFGDVKNKKTICGHF
jgi:hypothetical protein